MIYNTKCISNDKKATAYYLVISHQHSIIFFSGLRTHTLQDLRVRQLHHYVCVYCLAGNCLSCPRKSTLTFEISSENLVG